MSHSSVYYLVPYADTDQMGVVYYANYLIYFERARTQLLADQGMPYREMEAQGLALPVVEAQVHYKAPAHYDENLELQSWTAWVRGARLQINCAVYRGETLLASGHTVHACIDLRTRRPTRVPLLLHQTVAPETLTP